MSLENDVRRLATTRPFNLLPREALSLLAFSCEKRDWSAGETLFMVGQPADGAYFVLSGEVALTAFGEERRAGVGALIGENALTVDLDRAAEARIATDATLLKVPRDTFRRVLKEFPEATRKIHAETSKKTGELLGRLDAVRARAFEP